MTRPMEMAKREGELCLKDVLHCNDKKNLYHKILKLAVHADDYKFVHEVVEAITDAYKQADNGGAAVSPSPFPVPDPLTRESFKEMLLAYIRVGTTDPFGTTCLPCTASEATRTVARLGRLKEHSWIQHIIGVGGAGNVLAVADLCVSRARTDILEATLDPRPNGLLNSS